MPLVALPCAFLLLCFAAPTAYLFSASVLIAEGMIPQDQPTIDNFRLILSSPLYRGVILRTFVVGFFVGLLVVLLAYPLAYFLVRTRSRWKGALIALSLAPLLASVIVRTYGWYVILNQDGALNSLLLWAGLVERPLRFLPSTPAIIVGLAHALLPYGVLSIMSALNAMDPALERAALSLGASPARTFWRVTLPLTLPGVAAGFILAFAIAIGAYATPAILGGPATETMATMIRNFMLVLLDWGLGSAMGVILLASALALLAVAGLLGGGARRGTAAPA
ncbi:ABC transporter permease [Caldovatus sediminis]|uniref:ABC transporter permease n=1 Tax=Caldovatus sediminis TaxID=2041189 RepID=A0A8J2Z7Q1_9PROT|nr:ABC transporter permease [Caldovatus sediminis]